MCSNRTIFSQLTSFLPKKEFDKSVKKYKGNYNVKSFTCWEQFLCMMFAQLTRRESLRDIEICLRSFGKKLYHSGIRSKVSRSTLSYANENRDWRIYQDFAQKLIKEAQVVYINEPFGVELKNSVYAFDASIISLCLSVFPWAKFRETKAGIKLHTQLDLRGNIPVFIDISEAIEADVTALDRLILEIGAIYIFDRAFIDFKRLFRFQISSSFFIVRAKKGLAYERVYSHKKDKTLGVKVDQTIRLTSKKSRKNYPDLLRRIHYFDKEKNKNLIFLTNNFLLPAKTVADLYKCRWQVELFFKWIKQHLKIKRFFGTSINAVKTQIWIAISTYLLVAIVKKKLKINKTLYSFLQFLSLSLFEKTPIFKAFSDFDDLDEPLDSSNQLNLFNS